MDWEQMRSVVELLERLTRAMESIAEDTDIIRQKFEWWESVGDQD